MTRTPEKHRQAHGQMGSDSRNTLTSTTIPGSGRLSRRMLYEKQYVGSFICLLSYITGPGPGPGPGPPPPLAAQKYN